MLSTASLAHSSSSNKFRMQCCATKKKFAVRVTNAAAPSPFACPYRLKQQTAHRHFGAGLSMRSKPMLVSKAVCLLLQNTLCLCPQSYRQSLATRSLSGIQSQSPPQNADDSVSLDKAASDRAALDQCLSLIQQGRTIDGLTLLQQLTTTGIFPERQLGDAILLVSTKADLHGCASWRNCHFLRHLRWLGPASIVACVMSLLIKVGQSAAQCSVKFYSHLAAVSWQLIILSSTRCGSASGLQAARGPIYTRQIINSWLLNHVH